MELTVDHRPTTAARREKHYKWRGGVSAYREIAWAKFAKRCSLCSYRHNVEIHHINGNRYDNRLENLQPLCRSCHRLLHHRISTKAPMPLFLALEYKDDCRGTCGS